MLLRDGTVVPWISGGWSLENVSVDTALDSSQGCCALAADQAAEMLKGAAGSLAPLRLLIRGVISLAVFVPAHNFGNKVSQFIPLDGPRTVSIIFQPNFIHDPLGLDLVGVL